MTDEINSQLIELLTSLSSKLDFIYAAIVVMFSVGLSIFAIYILYKCIDKFITY